MMEYGRKLKNGTYMDEEAAEYGRAAEKALRPPEAAKEIDEPFLRCAGILIPKGVNLADNSRIRYGLDLDAAGNVIRCSQYGNNPKKYAVLDYIPVEPETSYHLRYLSNFGYGIYPPRYAELDADGNVVNLSAFEGQSTMLTTTADTRYLRLPWIDQREAESESKIQLAKSDVPVDYHEYEGLHLNPKWLPKSSGISGKRWAACGDSITAGYGFTVGDSTLFPEGERYAAEVRKKLGITELVYASSGAAYMTREGITIPTMYEQVEAASAEIDILTILGGTNDNYDGSTDTDSTDRTTFAGAVNATLRLAKLKHPYIPIIVTTILPRQTSGAGNESILHKNSIIRQCAAKYGIPVLDLYNAGLMPQALDAELTATGKEPLYADGLHPSAAGHQVLAKIFAGEIRKYLA